MVDSIYGTHLNKIFIFIIKFYVYDNINIRCNNYNNNTNY